MNTQIQTNTNTNNLFNKVYGYEEVKQELELIKSWYKNKDILNNPKITLPKGIIFHGSYGCGKTLLLREFSNSFDAPKYVIAGKEDNVCDEIAKTFAKARQDDFALILIDELDLLIGRNEHIERAFQAELDGINTKGKLLVLATTNHIHQISDALTRPGRFDRTIEINYPNRKSRELMFRKFLEELTVDTTNIDCKHLAKVITDVNGAEIKAICNDAYLRCNKNINTEDIETSYARVVEGNYSAKPKGTKNMRVAIHEAGHAIMTLHCKNNWAFYSAKFKEGGGTTETQETQEHFDSLEKREQSLMIGLSGYIAEELFYGKHDIGAYNDYSKVYEIARGFIERSGVEGYEHFIEPYRNNSDRYETPAKRALNERAIDKTLRKYEKETRRYLRKHTKDIKAFADLMYKNGVVTYKDIPSLGLNLN